MIITIDGPSASGKSTIARLLAQKLHFYYLDSGLLYRAIAYCAVKNGLPASHDDGSYVITPELLKEASHLIYRYEHDQAHVFLNEEDLTPYLRTEKCAAAASRLSSNPLIRHALMDLQRSLATEHSLVADGRDCGSVVYPHATIKFFLTAQLDVRAARRFKEIVKKQPSITLEQTKQEIAARDQRDRQRGVAPLIIPDETLVVDNSNMSSEETLSYFIDQIAKQTPNTLGTHPLHARNSTRC